MTNHKVKSICVITTTRADYGLFYWVMRKIKADKTLKLQLIVSGTHLEKEHGHTIDYIIKDGFTPDFSIPIIQKGNTIESVGKTSGVAIDAFTSAFAKLKPDAVLLLGDRYEMLAAAFAAAICVVPAVHFHGGEISEGANDDMFRHAITKLSVLHFVSTSEYKKRVIQMGEQPKNVYVSGALGLENISKLELLNKEQLEKSLGIQFKTKIFLITFHPATMEKIAPLIQVKNLLTSLQKFPDTTFVITKANADAGGNIINEELAKFCKSNTSSYLSASLGQINYLSVMSICDLVIGNSSSGIIEAPSFNKAVVNVGSRQDGRIKAKCNFDCKPDAYSIASTIRKALKHNGKVINPYKGKGMPSEFIIDTIKKVNVSKLLPKIFYDLK